MEPVCVLDFYVHEACQRFGIGRRLMEVGAGGAGGAGRGQGPVPLA
jgi:GNAT superfamily N-acetyltransferase